MDELSRLNRLLGVATWLSSSAQLRRSLAVRLLGRNGDRFLFREVLIDWGFVEDRSSDTSC
jgi:hypothetical protein